VQERLVALNKSLDEFTYISPHYLKEPLRGVHNYASFLRKTTPPNWNT
jgi:light-regulated signal transduction histidine kinase (bacteriophytochrome)